MPPFTGNAARHNAAGITLNAPPSRGTWKGPKVPTLVRGLPHDPEEFTTVALLARRLHQLRGKRAIEPVLVDAAYDGSDTLPAFNIWLTTEGETLGEWLGVVFAPALTLAQLTAAIAAENRDVPAKRQDRRTA